MTPNLPVYVIGAGGHAKVVVDILLCMGCKPSGITDADPANAGSSILGVPVIGDDSVLEDMDPSSIRLVLGIGAIKANSPRSKICAGFAEKGYQFATIIHPTAIIGHEVVIDEGAQIMSGVVIHPGAHIGSGAIINFGARIDHDCVIGAFSHIAPGVTLSGNTRIGANAHVGTGASIIQGITIGDGALVAAGACVVRDVEPGARVAGVPAKVLGQN